MQEDNQYNNPNIRTIGNKPKLTKQIVKDDVEVFLGTINYFNKDPQDIHKKLDENLGNCQNFCYIWNAYNRSMPYKHQSGMHAGHIAFPTYTATDHPILCNTLPDSLLLKQIVCDADLMQKYCDIYKFFYNKTTFNKEWEIWNNNNKFFLIDAFKVLLAGHYMAHNIVCLEKLSQKNGGTYTYQGGIYQITWKAGTINQYPYREFLNTLREIDKNEDMLKTIQSYIVATNGPGGQYKNESFALAAKYFIDELLANNSLRESHGKPTYNFNMVFDALVCAEINGKMTDDSREKLFMEYLKYYQDNYTDIQNNKVHAAATRIMNNKWDPSINCVNGTINNIAKYDTKNLNGVFNKWF